jgi:mannosyltransferase OCH1-like enzyme
MAKQHITLNRIQTPSKIFGNPLYRFEHKADIIRLEVLKQLGGIYLDIDVISLNSMKPLLSRNAVLGIQHGFGLCNAVILSQKDGEFLSLWHDQYRSFEPAQWDYHSVRLPLRLAKENPSLVHVVDEYSFFYPAWDDASQRYLWGSPTPLDKLKMLVSATKDARSITYALHVIRGSEWQYRKLLGSYCMHLWESDWYTKYLQEISPDTILSTTSNFSRLMRTILTHEELLRMSSTMQTDR